MKGFGIERFKGNCVKATEGFNIVLQHFQDQQCHLRKIRVQKWQEVISKPLIKKFTKTLIFRKKLKSIYFFKFFRCVTGESNYVKKSVWIPKSVENIYHQRINTSYYILPACFWLCSFTIRDQPLHWMEELKVLFFSESDICFSNLSPQKNFLKTILSLKFETLAHISKQFIQISSSG